MSSQIMQYLHGRREENNGDHRVLESSKLLSGEAAGRPVVYTSFRVMHQHLLQAELKRTISLITYRKPWMRYHQTKLTSYWETSTPVLVQGTLRRKTIGGRAEVLMDLAR